MYKTSTISIYVTLTIALAAACAVSLFAGAVHIPLNEMLSSDIVRLRIARIILGIVAGAGLSVSGVIFQALLRNPLAEPYILGVSSGAGLGAALAVILGITAISTWMLPAMAFVGAVATIFLVYAIARSSNGIVPVYTLLLSGTVISAAMGSILMFIISRSSSEQLHNVMWWLLGNLQILDWELLRVVSFIVAACIAVTIFLAHNLNVITLGQEPAAHLGLNVELTKKLFFLIASLMAGATVASCGLIGFVGLIVPHTVRLIVGPDHRKLVPAA
ncbi:MAG: iron ABC transporter permease, partial [Anaerohalosphaera sp.]|nr:iron ABC transporter permease [Anaerohalosphaera sp.]